MTWMPNPEFNNESKASPQVLAELSEKLKTHVTELSQYPAGRNDIHADNLTPSKDYISQQFSRLGLTPSYHQYEQYGDQYANIIIDIPASNASSSILIIGAHYDSVENVPGANDNASGVAALIELGRHLSINPPTNHNIRLIAFTNEEPPYFWSNDMGSRRYVSQFLNPEENILAMISLETLGYYTDEKNSQQYPKLFSLLYPSTGNFVAFVGNLQSRSLVSTSISTFRENSDVPSEGISAPAFIPGVGWSDHSSFWEAGHKAIMITDTAPYRYEHYHEPTDTHDKLNYDQYASVVYGVFSVINELASH